MELLNYINEEMNSKYNYNDIYNKKIAIKINTKKEYNIIQEKRRNYCYDNNINIRLVSSTRQTNEITNTNSCINIENGNILILTKYDVAVCYASEDWYIRNGYKIIKITDICLQ